VNDLAYEGRGTAGPAVILLHGFPLDARMWRGQLAGLGELARVVAVDLPGFGRSPPPDVETLTMDDLAGNVMAVADALGFDRFVLGGLSMGGYVALAAHRRYASRLEGLILCDTRAEADPEPARAGRHADAARALAEGTAFFVDRQRDSMFAPATLASRPELVAEVETWMRAVSPATLAAALRGMAARPDAQGELARITAPTLVISGRDDKITPPEGMAALARAIPGATLAQVPGGHLAPLEHPDETVAAIAAFLTRR
jgi:3-oxoadipate enol-lactonase